MQIKVSFPDWLLSRIKAEARDYGMPVSAIVRRAVEEHYRNFHKAMSVLPSLPPPSAPSFVPTTGVDKLLCEHGKVGECDLCADIETARADGMSTAICKHRQVEVFCGECADVLAGKVCHHGIAVGEPCVNCGGTALRRPQF